MDIFHILIAVFLMSFTSGLVPCACSIALTNNSTGSCTREYVFLLFGVRLAFVRNCALSPGLTTQLTVVDVKTRRFY